MTEIRCPMCGKPNPDDLDVCQFCEARLKPLTSSIPSDLDPADGTTPEQPEFSSDLPDWLDFGDDSQIENDDQAASDDENLFDDSDDWIARLKNDQESSEASQPGTEPDDEQQSSGRMDFDNNGIPDWLDDLEKTRSTPPQDQLEEPGKDEFPTWLTADEGSDQPGTLPDWLIDSSREDEEAAPRSAAEDDFTDWLSDQGLKVPDASNEDPSVQPSTPAFTADKADELPDWLTADDDSPEQSSQDAAEGDLPDWLSDLGGEQPASSEEIPSTPAFSADEVDEFPDWLTADDDSPEQSSQDAAEGDLPDWLSNLGGEHPASSEEIPSTPAFSADEVDELPDWLTADDDSPEQSSQDAVEGELPIWLSDQGDEQPTSLEETPSAQPSTPDSAAEEADEFFSLISDESDSSEEDVSVQPAAEAELPDWLSDPGGEEPVIPEKTDITQASTPAFITDDSEDLPGLPTDQENGEVEDLHPDQESGLPTWFGNAENEDDELPDWFSDLGAEEISESQEIIIGDEPIENQEVPPTRVISVPASISDEANELPDWLMEDDTSDGGDDKYETGTPPVEEDLPDWLSDLASEETVSDQESGEEADVFDELTHDQDDTLDSTPDTEITGVTDWLTGGDVDEVETVLSPAESDLSDWLMGEDQVEAESVTPDQESDLPDWISDLGGEEISVPEEEVLANEVEDLPEWLRTEEVGQADSDQPTEESDLPDWLQGEDQVEAESVTPDQESDLPSWISDLGGEEISVPEEAMLADEAEDLPEWLRAEEADQADRDQPAEESDLPDWLQGEDQVDAESVTPDQESETLTPVSDQESEGFSAAEAAMATAVLANELTDLPEWLRTEEEDQADSDLPTEESDLPDWLQGEDQVDAESVTPDQDSETLTPFSDQEGEGINAAEATMATTVNGLTDLPEWLRTEEEDQADRDLPTEESDLPDWLRGEDQIEAESVTPDQESETLTPVSDQEGEGFSAAEAAMATAVLANELTDLPEWLKADEQADTDSNLLTEEISGEDAVDEAVRPAISDEDQIPAWISDVNGIEKEPSPEVLPESELDELPENYDESQAVPDWMQDGDGEPVVDRLDEKLFGDDQDTDTADAASYEIEDVFEDDLRGFDQLPEWLSDSSITDVDQQQGITEPINDDLATADLPGWLAAMRPVESATSKALDVDQSDIVESSGPLVGLYSVLAAQPGITQFKKPPVYSNKLQVTEAQQQNANLLGNMIEAEGKAQALPSAPLITSHRVFRLILGILLLVIAFIAVFIEDEMVGMPAPEVIPSGVEQSFQIISSLSQEDTVLISFDFEPGLIGEMDATSAALLDNIMEKGAKLALVSTSPTGPALAERFINDVQDNHQYSAGIQYVNLGYIPGGVSGLAAFAQNPNWAAPTSLDGGQAWETQPLINIKSISDFSLVLLISDNPNTTRAWVEQVNPHLEPVPLVAVVSAQVEPVARTYLGQIDGLISGLAGGAAYEVMAGANLAREQWDAFNIILIVAVSAILIGGSISVIPKILAKQKNNGGESE